MSNDKTKIILIAVLVAALASVGAWQFIGSDNSNEKKTPKETKKITVAAHDEETDPFDEISMLFLERKDPFVPGRLNPDPLDQTPSTRTVTPPPPTPQPTIRPTIEPGTGVPPFDPGSGNAEFSTAPPIRTSNEFPYSLIGVLEGPRPVAVFQSDLGAQMMVAVNGSIGRRGKVVKISNGQVTVLHNGKKITLTVGGNSK